MRIIDFGGGFYMVDRDDGQSFPMLFLRLARAVGALLFTVASLVVVLALFGRDFGLASFLDAWFGEWSELQLTVVGAVMLGLSALALRHLERSEQRYAFVRQSADRQGH